MPQKQPTNLNPIIYYLLANFLSNGQIGQRQNNPRNQAEAYQGWNYLAIRTVGQNAARAHGYVYDNSKPNASSARKFLKGRYKSVWRSFAQDGAADLVDDQHPAAKLVDKPNPKCKGGLFRWEYILQMHLHGMCLIFNRPTRSRTRTCERYILPIALTEPVYQGEYKEAPNGGVRLMPYDAGLGGYFNSTMSLLQNCIIPVEMLDVVQYPHPYLIGTGCSPTEANGWWIDVANMIDQTRWKQMKRGPKPAGMMTVPIDTTATDASQKLEEFSRYINNKLRSEENENEVLVAANGTLVSDKLTPLEMAYNESHEVMGKGILANHGISLAMAGLTDNMTYGSLAASLSQGLMGVQSDLDLLSENFTALFERDYPDGGLSCEFEVQGYDDPTLLEQKIPNDINSCTMRVREYRALRGWAPFGDKRDDARITPQGLVFDNADGTIEPTKEVKLKDEPKDAPKSFHKSIVMLDPLLGDTSDLEERMTVAGIPYVTVGDITDDEPILLGDECYTGTTQSRLEALASLLPQEQASKLLGAEKPHQYGCLMLDVPDSVKSAVAGLQGNLENDDLVSDGIEVSPHITLLYGLFGCSLDDIQKAIRSIPAMDVVFGQTSYWDNDKECVLKIDIQSKALNEANAKLRDSLPHIVTHPEFKPHLTLAYVNKAAALKHSGQNPLTGQSARLTHLIVSHEGQKARIPLKG